ncbi:hypothetical protein HDV05_004842 [Chytridiales sp. JEL 0842]|nr:hypothetical protein HDV05_004842 [Chytridiales sp. JEL 0842]
MFASSLLRRAAPQTLRTAASRRAASTSVFSKDTFAKYVPQVKLQGSTTLGEIWDAAFVKYRYRLAYPIAIWVGFLWYNLSGTLKTPEEKKELRARGEKLKSLEFHQ